MSYFFYLLLFLIINVIIYDKYVQRKHQLLINYPLIGRMRYVFEALREPFRQYFGDETFYESKDKVDWVYDTSREKNGYISFSPSTPQPNPKFLIKHSNRPLNDDEVDDEFSITFGADKKYPYTSKSIIFRSAMSDGESGTAPLFLMDRVGFHVKDAIHIAHNILINLGIRDELKLVASSKILTPDDVIVTMALGADYIGIARGFMLSGGCIRARMCAGEGSHKCPVGLATQDEKLRRSYLVYKKSKQIKNYHNALLKGIKTILAVMGKKNVNELKNSDLSFIDKNGFIYTNVSRYLDKKIT